MVSISIVQNDTLPAVEATLTERDGTTPVNISAGSTVIFNMVDTNGTFKTSGGASIVSGEAGRVKYEWVTGDTDTVGSYKAEFEVTFPSGAKLTFPSDGKFFVHIREEYG